MSTWFDEKGWLLQDIPAECVADCSHSGSCDDDVAYWTDKLSFDPPRDLAIKYLREYGAWTAEELAESTDEQLAHRILWLACCDLKEGESYVGMVH